MPQPDQPDHDRCAGPAEFSTRGMLVKLILLPALLVFLLVATIVWRTRPGDEVDSLIDALAQPGEDRWPAAMRLGALLSQPGSDAIRRDPQTARRLIEILEKEIAAGRMEPEEIGLRMCLCQALGEFRIADPLSVLLEAARLQRDEKKVDVRRAAIAAVAVLASNVGPARLRGEDQLLAVLLEAAEDPHGQVRETAAFALGVVGGDRAQARLEKMLADPHAEARYNAATGLARHGDAACTGVLLEMLDPQQTDSRRTLIQMNALQAVGKLAAANRTAARGELAQAVERLTRADAAEEVRAKAADVLHRLER